MPMKLMITTAIVVAALAGPALAGDHDLETELRDSGRYVPQANLPDVTGPGWAGAYASAGVPSRAFSRTPFVWVPPYDFQLDGR